MTRSHVRTAPGPPSSAGEGRSWALAGLGFAAALLLLLWPLFTQKVEPRWDARDMGYPAFAYTADAVRDGRLPLWDPYSSCGYPFYADPGSLAFNPLAMAIGGIVPDAALGFVLYWTIHWLWAGLGMMWLARRFGATAAGGLVAAFSYALSGFFIGHAEHTSFITTAAWMPWIIGLADRSVASSNFGYALLSGAALGLCALVGYPGLVTFSGPAVVLWLALRFLLPGGGEGAGDASVGRRAVRIAVTAGLIGLVSLAVWSPSLQAFFTEGRNYTDRVAPLSAASANFDSPFPLAALFTLLFPYAGVAGAKWMQVDVSMLNGYVGILAVPLAAYWWARGGGPRRPWWILAFVLFMLLVSLGGQAGLRTALYYLFPPMRYMRFSAPFRLYWILPVSLAAGLGYSALARSPQDRRYALKIFLGWAIAAAAGALSLGLLLDAGGVPPGDVAGRLFLPGAAALSAAVVLLWRGAASPDGAVSRWLPLGLALLCAIDGGAHLLNNSHTVWAEIDSMKQVESYRRTATFVPGEPGPRHPPRYFGFFNIQQVVKEPTVQGYMAMKTRGFDEVLCRSRFAEVLQSPLRFWMSPAGEKTPPFDTALSILAGTGAGNAVPVFVDDVPDGPPSGRIVPGSYGRTRVLSYAPERVVVEADVPGPSGGLLASTEKYAPGWRVSVDGAPGKVLRTNLYFRGTRLPPGRHQIVWEYRPSGLGPLAAVGACTLLAAAGLGIRLLRRPPGGGGRPGRRA